MVDEETRMLLIQGLVNAEVAFGENFVKKNGGEFRRIRSFHDESPYDSTSVPSLHDGGRTTG